MADPKLTPRKEPRQHRARATVEAMVIAAEQLTRERGVDDWTTNHAAERAGVSIGSLYQYFPSKESLVVALYLHRREAYVERVAEALVSVGKAGTPRDIAAAIGDVWLGDGGPAIDWAFDLGLRAWLTAASATRKLVSSDQHVAAMFAQLMVRRGWAATDAPARGAS